MMISPKKKSRGSNNFNEDQKLSCPSKACLYAQNANHAIAAAT